LIEKGSADVDITNDEMKILDDKDEYPTITGLK